MSELRRDADGRLLLFPELQNAALVRELHVYGKLIATHSAKGSSDAQHTGLGTRMMLKAEEIARQHGKDKVAVISGIGARGFYKKIGYETRGRGGFMLKDVRASTSRRLLLVPILNLILIFVAIASFVKPEMER